MLSKEQIQDQRLCYAVKACYMMRKTAKETSRLLCMPESQVRLIYNMIRKNMIDFD